MYNSFEDQDAKYRVVVNHEGQHSLWPVSIEVPAGWTNVHGPAGRSQCLEYVEKNWTDMRPNSLRQMMEATKH